MGRTTPPPAIIAPPLEAMIAEPKFSDLPLRNFALSDEASPNTASPPTLEMPPTPPEDTPGLSVTSTETPNDPDQDLATPSSTIVEFDDGLKDDGLPAVEVAGEIFRSFSRSRSRSGNSEIRGSSRTATPRPSARRPRSKTRAESTPRQKREPSESVTRYLRGMARSPPVDPSRELILENTSLQQRIAALQRIERDLLTENHGLAHQLASLREHHDSRRKKWRDQYRDREQYFHDRIRELEDRIIRQELQLQQYAQTVARDDRKPLLSDNEIIAWFTTRTISWQAWSEEFAHPDPKRLQAGLHPVQMLELCDSVKPFVRISDNGLPEELVDTDGGSGVKSVPILLHGMLADFIVTETLKSPFWMFNVLSSGGMDLESPSAMHANSPIGFRMDLALWSNAAPPRIDRPSVLPPKTARLMQEPTTGRHVPPVTPLPALSLNTAGLSGIASQNMPGKKDMDNLYGLLSNVQQNDRDMHAWRAQLIRTLSEGGLSLEPEKVEGEERRRLADARKTHAKNLKDRFLNGAARFLLKDQDPAGIERLELRLVKEFELALKFSCHVWSRPDPLRIQGLEELANTAFSTSSQIMDLCPGQAPLPTRLLEELKGVDLPPAYHDGHTVIMAVQPAIESITLEGKHDQNPSRVLSKARVVVAAPKSDSASIKAASPALSNKTPAQVWSQAVAQAAAPVVAAVEAKASADGPDAAPRESGDVLPGVAFKPVSRPPLAKSPPKPTPVLLSQTSFSGPPMNTSN